MAKKKVAKKATKKVTKKVTKKSDKKVKVVYHTIRQMMRGEGITREQAMKRVKELSSGAYATDK